MFGRKEKCNTTIKINNTTRRHKSKGTGERRKIKKILRQDQIIKTKREIPIQQKKIVPVNRGRMYEDIPKIG